MTIIKTREYRPHEKCLWVWWHDPAGWPWRRQGGVVETEQGAENKSQVPGRHRGHHAVELQASTDRGHTLRWGDGPCFLHGKEPDSQSHRRYKHIQRDPF